MAKGRLLPPGQVSTQAAGEGVGISPAEKVPAAEKLRMSRQRALAAHKPVVSLALSYSARGVTSERREVEGVQPLPPWVLFLGGAAVSPALSLV